MGTQVMHAGDSAVNGVAACPVDRLLPASPMESGEVVMLSVPRSAPVPAPGVQWLTASETEPPPRFDRFDSTRPLATMTPETVRSLRALLLAPGNLEGMSGRRDGCFETGFGVKFPTRPGLLLSESCGVVAATGDGPVCKLSLEGRTQFSQWVKTLVMNSLQRDHGTEHAEPTALAALAALEAFVASGEPGPLAPYLPGDGMIRFESNLSGYEIFELSRTPDRLRYWWQRRTEWLDPRAGRLHLAAGISCQGKLSCSARANPAPVAPGAPVEITGAWFRSRPDGSLQLDSITVSISSPAPH